MKLGLCPENPDDVGVPMTEANPGEDDREEPGVEDLSMKEAVDESRSLEGTFDCEPLAEG